MTSMPASRSAAATTLAPRSWPSSPGFATSTRIGLDIPTRILPAPLTRNQCHGPGATPQWPLGPAIVRFLDDKALGRKQLGEARRGVQAYTILSLRVSLADENRHDAGERVEGALMRDQRAIVALPPILGHEAGHHAIAAGPVPHEYATRLEHTRELVNDLRVIRRVEKEPERREQVHHAIEPASPLRWQASHVASPVLHPGSLGPG